MVHVLFAQESRQMRPQFNQLIESILERHHHAQFVLANRLPAEFLGRFFGRFAFTGQEEGQAEKQQYKQNAVLRTVFFLNRLFRIANLDRKSPYWIFSERRNPVHWGKHSIEKLLILFLICSPNLPSDVRANERPL